MKAEDLVGTWRLRSWKNAGSDGSEVYPLGERPVGYIFYSQDGYMSVEIMAKGRMPYQEPDVFGGTRFTGRQVLLTCLSIRWLRSSCNGLRWARALAAPIYRQIW